MRPPTDFQPGWPIYTAGGKRGAEHRAGERADAVGQQDLAQIEVVAGRGCALDVVHAFGEVVDAERHGDDQKRADVGQTRQEIGGWDRHVQAELVQRGDDRVRVHHRR